MATSSVVDRFRASAPHAARIIAQVYLMVITIGGLLLALPASRSDGKFGGFLESSFTSVSAVCVTGLSTVDTQSYWTPFGHLVILLLVKLGGLGILSIATLIAMILSKRVGIRTAMIGATESSNLSSGDIRGTLARIAIVSSIFEAFTATVLAIRYMTEYHFGLGDAVWHGTFHSVSAFNNAGFALYSDSFIGFQSDPWIILPLCFNVIMGSFGFLVLFEVGRRIIGRVERRRIGEVIESRLHWTLTTRIVLWASGILLVLGTVFILGTEWNNPKTLGPMDFWQKLLSSFAYSTFARSAGLNTIDISSLSPTSMLGSDILMFIGGASGSTAGGIKVTTAAVLIFIVWTEIRGGTAVNIGNRRLPRSLQRQALTVISLSFVIVIAASMALHLMTSFNTDKIIFEVISAFATTGVTNGVTAGLPPAGQILFMVLMFVGRLGTVLVASSLAARVTHMHYEYPRERPMIG